MPADMSTGTVLLIVLASTAAMGLTVAKIERRDARWILDPRGLLPLILWWSNVGLLLHRLTFDDYPRMFGLIPAFIGDASVALLLAQVGFLVGTRIAANRFRTVLPDWRFDEVETKYLLKVMALAALCTAALRYIDLAMRGAAVVIGTRYGELQWEAEGQYALPVLRASTIAVPTLLLYLVARGASGRRLTSPRVWLVIAFVGAPAAIMGGRRDIVVIAAGLALGGVLRRREPFLFRRVATVAVLVLCLSLLVQASRRGVDLSATERLRSIGEYFAGDRGETVVRDTYRMFVGQTVVTAAMCIYPEVVPFAVGRTYMESAANLLFPRFLSGEYLFTPPGLRFREIFYANVRGLGLDYSLAAEAYENFGMLGPPLVHLSLALFLVVTFGAATRHGRGFNLWLLPHIHLLFSSMWALRTDSTTGLKAYVYGVVWIFLLCAGAKLWAADKVRYGSLRDNDQRAELSGSTSSEDRRQNRWSQCKN